MRNRWFSGALGLVVLAGLAGCYKPASANRAQLGIGSVAISPLVNETSFFAVEQVLTRSLVRGFVEKTRYQVVDNPSEADAVLEGAVSRLTASPVTFGSGSFGSTFVVTLTARVSLTDRRSGKILFKNDRFTFREQYVINADVSNFFSEQNPAFDRIAADFASSVVTSVLEGF